MNTFKPLHFFCDKIFDGTHDSPKYTTSGMPLVTSKFLNNGIINYEKAPLISNNDYHLVNKRSKIEENDILFSMIGSIGETAIVTYDHYAIKNLCCIRAKDLITTKYLYIYFNSFIFKKVILSINKGAVQKFLNLEQMKNLPILNLNSYSQQHIVDIIGSLDKKINILYKINFLLENQLNKIFNTYMNECMNKIKNFTLLSDIFNFDKGFEPGSENLFSDVNTNLIEYYKVGDLNHHPKSFVSKSLCKEFLNIGDVAISLDGTPGKVSCTCKGAFSSGIRKVTSKKDNIENWYIYTVLKQQYIQKIIKLYSTGSNILHASESLKYLSVPFDISIIEKYNSFGNKIYNTMIVNSKQINEINKYKNYILPLILNEQIN